MCTTGRGPGTGVVLFAGRIKGQREPNFSLTSNGENYSIVIAPFFELSDTKEQSWDLYSPGFMIYLSIAFKLHEIIWQRESPEGIQSYKRESRN